MSKIASTVTSCSTFQVGIIKQAAVGVTEDGERVDTHLVMVTVHAEHQATADCGVFLCIFHAVREYNCVKMDSTWRDAFTREKYLLSHTPLAISQNKCTSN